MDDTEKHKLNRQFYTQVTIQMKQKTRLLRYVLISLVVEVLIPSLNLSSMYIVNIIYIFFIQSLELTIRIRSDRFKSDLPKSGETKLNATASLYCEACEKKVKMNRFCKCEYVWTDENDER